MTKSMTSGKPVKLILLFALPLIVGNIFQQFYSMADTVIVGRTIGVNALAAVGCTGSVSFFILGFVMGFTSGLSILIAQRFGAEDEEGIRCSFAAGIILSIALTIVMTFFAVALVRPAMELLQTPEEILDDAVSYIRIIFWGIGASVLFNLGSNTMRALGDSRTPLYFLIFACCVNIVLDIVLIAVVGMGVAGAGVATIFSQLLSGICCFVYIWKKMPVLRINRHHFHLAQKQLGAHLRIAFPMAFQMSIIAIGALILQFALNGLGAVSVAAYTAAQKIDSIATMPLNSLGQAMTTYTAQNYGAGNHSRIRTGIRHAFIMSISFSIVISLIVFLFAAPLMKIFIAPSEHAVIAAGVQYLRIEGSFYCGIGCLFLLYGYYRAINRAEMSVVLTVISLGLRVLLAYILSGVIGVTGIWIAIPIGWLLADAVGLLYMKKTLN